jgi:Ca2+-binding EF-hand superfamily protein
VSGGLVDLKAFKQILRDHRPTYTNAEKYFTGLLQDIKIDENGMIDPNYMRVVFKNVGQKIGEINVDMFLKGLKKEENGKIKIETIAKRLATLNPL